MPHLLIVEDDPAIRDLFEIAFEGSQFTVETQADGAQAVASIKKTPPDAVVTDFMLPGADGLEVCRALRRATSGQLVPALIITGANVQSERLVEALQIPGVMIVTKPVHVSALPGLLHSLTQHWSSEMRSPLEDIAHQAADPERLLPGEDPQTQDIVVAERWQRTYEHLTKFKHFMLTETKRAAESADEEGSASELRETDIPFLEGEHARLTQRRNFWSQRVADLGGQRQGHGGSR